MHSDPPVLHMLCGKIASGKSTLAARLAARPRTVLVAEDTWLSALFADELNALDDYVRCSSKLRDAMGPHIAAILDTGVSVVLDFAANTTKQRSWMKGILKTTRAGHQLHLLDVPDEICLARLRARNASGDHPFSVSEAQFHQVSGHFSVPTAAEGFMLVVHGPAGEPEAKGHG